MTNKSILLLMKKDGWGGHGDMMSRLNIQAWWWTESFSACLLCQWSNRLTWYFLWQEINTKTSHVFHTKPAFFFKSKHHIKSLGLFLYQHPDAPHPPGSRADKHFLCYSPYFVYVMKHCVSVTQNAFLQLPYWTDSLMEKRAGEESKINNLFYLMGWSVTVMR